MTYINVPMENIDIGIRDMVVWLNKQGYKTIFSCEGHYFAHKNNEHDYISGFYIVFECNQQRYNFLNQIINKPIFKNFLIEKTQIINEDDLPETVQAFRYNYQEISKKEVEKSHEDINILFGYIKKEHS